MAGDAWALPTPCGADTATSGGRVHQPVHPSPSTTVEFKLDPSIFFQRLVDRYRGLYLYKDMIHIVHVTRRDGQETSRVESQMECEVAEGELKVKSPASQARDGLRLNVHGRQDQSAFEAQRKYDLWLAPHMTLKFTENPLKELRAGVNEGFTATEAEAVTIDNKRMVHVELRSGNTRDGASETGTAKVDLYVNSDSMLIERIETEQRLPDGADYTTTLDIKTEQAEGQTPTAETAPIPAGSQTLEPIT
jgi:hypothetical protein